MHNRDTQCLILIKGALKIACSFNNNVSASGELLPKTPVRNPAGVLPSPDPSFW